MRGVRRALAVAASALLLIGFTGVARACASTPTPECRITGKLVTCYSPAQLRAAYGVAPLLDRGIDGRGQTVVLWEVAVPATAAARARASDIHQDLAGYDTHFGLPPVATQVDAGLIGPSADPALATGEEVEDTELLHAIAPRARIRILLVNLRAGAGNAALEGYGVALRYAIPNRTPARWPWQVSPRRCWGRRRYPDCRCLSCRCRRGTRTAAAGTAPPRRAPHHREAAGYPAEG
jgi:hypothetical protein